MAAIDLAAPTVLPLGPTGLPVVPAVDVLAGHPGGLDPAVELPWGADPLAALRAALRPALRCSPCIVAFSGGRDSSLVLAVAADTAARDGLPAPVACTLRYPGDTAAEESDWQELMIAHLHRHGRDVEWIRRDVTDELDLIGPLTVPVLSGHGGPTFPPAIGPTVLLSGVARDGALVTGNFGDEVLGDHRAATLRAVWRRRGRGMTAADRRTTALAAAPAPVRRALLRRRITPHPWLRTPAREAVVEQHVRDVAARPACWDASVRATLRPRAVRIGALTRAQVAAWTDCALVEPLGAPGFVAALARYGGRWGRLGRTAATRALGGPLIPPEIAGRRTKAHFNGSRFGAATRHFAASWSGAGVDPGLVDVEELRHAWLCPVPPAASAMLLQQAWLADGATR